MHQDVGDKKNKTDFLTRYKFMPRLLTQELFGEDHLGLFPKRRKSLIPLANNGLSH